MNILKNKNVIRLLYVSSLVLISMGAWVYYKMNEWNPESTLPSLVSYQSGHVIKPNNPWISHTINGDLLMRPFYYNTTIHPGQSFAEFLVSNFNVSAHDSYKIIQALSHYLNFRSIKPTENFRFKVNGFGDIKNFSTMEFNTAPDEKVVVYRQSKVNHDALYKVKKKIIPLKTINRIYKGKIISSLSESLSKHHVPISIIDSFIDVLAYEVDFQRDIQEGDSYVIYYKDSVNANNMNSVGDYSLYYVQLNLHGSIIKLYRFQNPKNHKIGYFHSNGRSSRSLLIRTPTKATRISSRFGFRSHPILGYSRMHKGIDFAAPSGTPVYAAGSGVVIYKGKTKGYGNRIDIRHSNGYVTRYGHMRSFAHNIHVGSRVKQKQIIGYVGMTGLATGPHLHYEIQYHRKAINPASVKIPSIHSIPKRYRKIFTKDENQINFIIEHNV